MKTLSITPCYFHETSPREVQIVHTSKLLMCRHNDGLGGHDGYVRVRNAREILEYLGEEVPDKRRRSARRQLYLR